MSQLVGGIGLTFLGLIAYPYPSYLVISGAEAAVVATEGPLDDRAEFPSPVMQLHFEGPEPVTAVPVATAALLGGLQDDVIEPVGDVVFVFALVVAAAVSHPRYLLDNDPVSSVELI